MTEVNPRRLLYVLAAFLLLCPVAMAQNCQTYLPDPASFPFPVTSSGAANITVTKPNGSVNSFTTTFSRQILFDSPQGRAATVFGASGTSLFRACNNVFISLSGSHVDQNGIFSVTTTVSSSGGIMSIDEAGDNTVINPDGLCPSNCLIDQIHYDKIWNYDIRTGEYTITHITDRHFLGIDPSTGDKTESFGRDTGNAAGTWPLLGANLKLTLDQQFVEPSKSQNTLAGKQAAVNTVVATATVTDGRSNPVPDGFVVNISFDVKDVSVSGHDHTNYDILNAVIRGSGGIASCSTLQDACSITLKVPEVSGLFKVTATAASDSTVTDNKELAVQLATPLVNLTESSSPQFFFLTGYPGRQDPKSSCQSGDFSAHFENHYATSYVQRAVQSVSYSYSQRLSAIDGMARALGINDMSLGSAGVGWGGLFDICNDWVPSHYLHRNGRSVDIDSHVTVGSNGYNPTEPVKVLLLYNLFKSWGFVKVHEGPIHFEYAN
jgi:hypothetical protein